jgi:hypothetical protein
VFGLQRTIFGRISKQQIKKIKEEHYYVKTNGVLLLNSVA